MLFNSNHNNRTNYFSAKRFFIIVLFINTFLGCIYFIHEQKEPVINSLTRTTPIWEKIINNFQDEHTHHHHHPKETTKALTFIRNVLESEYKHDDLNRFYNHVQQQYSLGLKCTRKQNLTNLTNSSLSPFNQTHSRRHNGFHRTDLFKYKISNSDTCFNQSVDLVIIIISKSENYKTRDAIRRTWASGKNLGIYSKFNIKYLFLIDYNEHYSYSIQLENDLFHDIIHVELLQQYTLVTHRVLSVFEWSFRYCRSAKYLIKTDDDLFINLILLLKFLRPLVKKPIDNTFKISDMHMYGYAHVNPIVFRQANDSVLARYIVTIDEFPCKRYPTFLSGFGYLISKKARDAILYTAYQDPEPFRVSDVYFTGIIPDYLALPRHSYPDFKILYETSCEHFFYNTTAYACAIGSHHGASGDIFQEFDKYWRIIRKENGLIQEII